MATKVTSNVISDNLSLSGTEGVTLPSGTTAEHRKDLWQYKVQDLHYLKHDHCVAW